MIPWLTNLFKPKRRPIPDLLWRACVAHLHCLHNLSSDELSRLRIRTEGVLATVPMRGAAGFEVTDKVAVLIAAQAALLVLNLTEKLYSDTSAVIVYPSGFIVPRKQTDIAGVVHEWNDAFAGEAIQEGGAVVLSWEDIENTNAGPDARNVVLHEFAHKIDMKRSIANGFPPFLTKYHRSISPRQWQDAFSRAYRDFTIRVGTFHHMSHGDFGVENFHDSMQYERAFSQLPMDPYGATNPAEFFAVASETFFLRPGPLSTVYPDIYRLLWLYYRQDTLARPPVKAWG